MHWRKILVTGIIPHCPVLMQDAKGKSSVENKRRWRAGWCGRGGENISVYGAGHCFYKI